MLDRTITEKINAAILDAGDIILQADRSTETVTEKAGHANFVTSYDKAVQEMLQERLLQILPEAVFVGEEEDVHAQIKDGYSFIVDPIDGTTNFIRDMHCSTVSIGLLFQGEPVYAAIYNPYLQELYTAEKGQGAFLNGQPIHVSEKPLSESIILFGTSPYYPELAKKSFELLINLFNRALDVRRFGSAAYDLCMVAAGRAELFFEMQLSPWDYAAGALIVKEAGGTATQLNGEPLSYGHPCSVLARGGQNETI